MRWLLLYLILSVPCSAFAESIRFAVYNTGLSRKGPGVLFRDIVNRKAPDVEAVISIIQKTRADVLLVMDFDHDFGGRAAEAFQQALNTGEGAIEYQNFFAPEQNAGLQSGLDLNGNGRLGDAADGFGYGRFRGDGAMLLLSRFPMDTDKAKDFSDLLWSDLDWAEMPKRADGSPFPSVEVAKVMRLSSKGHWDVPILTPDGSIVRVLISHASPPVFDGPEDANGLRNWAENEFWQRYIDQGELGDDRFVLMLGANADPNDGEGSHEVIRGLMNDPNIQDPKPTSAGGLEAKEQGGVNDQHLSPAENDTVDWRDNNAGNLRVDYVLPSSHFRVSGSGVFWPTVDDPDVAMLEEADTSHRLVWVDVE